MRETGLKVDTLISCAQNETDSDCPAFTNPSLQSFIVAAHNAKAVTDNQFIRIALPTNFYKAEIWDGSHFKDASFDILEQLHFKPGGIESMSYEMYVDYAVKPNEVAVIKVSKTEKPHVFVPRGSPVTQSKSSLEISGFTEQNEALFKFKNSESNISQSFGISLRKWNSKKAMKDQGFSDGPYLFQPNEFNSRAYSKIDTDVTYEEGQSLEQWTIRFFEGKQFA